MHFTFWIAPTDQLICSASLSASAQGLYRKTSSPVIFSITSVLQGSGTTLRIIGQTRIGKKTSGGMGVECVSIALRSEI